MRARCVLTVGLLLSACGGGGGFARTLKPADSKIESGPPHTPQYQSVRLEISESTAQTADEQTVQERVMFGLEAAFEAGGYQVVSRLDGECSNDCASVALTNVELGGEAFLCDDSGTKREFLMFRLDFDVVITSGMNWTARVDVDSGLLAARPIGIWPDGNRYERCEDVFDAKNWVGGNVAVCEKDGPGCEDAQQRLIEAAGMALIQRFKG